MKHIKLFENFQMNEGYTLPEDILDFESNGCFRFR
jgi:hypothetical protein